MEPLKTTNPLKYSVPKARVFAVFLSVVLCTAILCLLQLRFFKPRIKDFYSFEVKDSRGRTISLEKYRGKATLVVNVASYCQHTDKNYIALQELYREYGPSHFTVLAFPCNQFGESEPSSSQEVESFAKGNYGVTFPVLHKIKILGSEAEPAFKFLIDSSKKEPRWNFWKYLVSPDGKVVKFWRPEEPIESIKPEVALLVRQIIVKKEKTSEKAHSHYESTQQHEYTALLHSQEMLLAANVSGDSDSPWCHSYTVTATVGTVTSLKNH